MALTFHEITMADAWLNREYVDRLQQLGTHTQESIDQGAVTASNLSIVEETWLTYRDAWVAFARLRYLRERDDTHMLRLAVGGFQPKFDAGVGASRPVVFRKNICIDQETTHHPRSTERGWSLDRVRSRLAPAKGEFKRRSERFSNRLRSGRGPSAVL